VKGKSLIFAVIAGIAGVAGLAAAASAAQLDVFPQDNIVALSHGVDAQYQPIATEILVSPESHRLIAVEHAAPRVAAQQFAATFEALVYELSPGLPFAASDVALALRSRSDRMRSRNSLSTAVGAVDI
jgi:hypothetical protein